MGVGAGLYMCDVVKSSRSLSHLLMSSCSIEAATTRNTSCTAFWHGLPPPPGSMICDSGGMIDGHTNHLMDCDFITRILYKNAY